MMADMHEKLTKVDSETQAAIIAHTTPVYEQLSAIQAKNTGTDEYLAYIATAVAGRNTDSTCQPCGACPASADTGNPWVVPPGIQPPTPPVAFGHGDGAGASDDPHRRTMNAIIGGNGACHCVHVKELIEAFRR